jgi:hypothetical protein
MPSRPIRPKISTMPRPKSEASAYLNMYQLAVEKKRLQQELQQIQQRCLLIQQRLVDLDRQIAETAADYQQPQSLSKSPSSTTIKSVDPTQETKDFKTMLVEY